MSEKYTVSKMFEVTVTRTIDADSLEEAAVEAEKLKLGDFVEIKPHEVGAEAKLCTVCQLSGTQVCEPRV